MPPNLTGKNNTIKRFNAETEIEAIFGISDIESVLSKHCIDETQSLYVPRLELPNNAFSRPLSNLFGAPEKLIIDNLDATVTKNDKKPYATSATFTIGMSEYCFKSTGRYTRFEARSAGDIRLATVNSKRGYEFFISMCRAAHPGAKRIPPPTNINHIYVPNFERYCSVFSGLARLAGSSDFERVTMLSETGADSDSSRDILLEQRATTTPSDIATSKDIKLSTRLVNSKIDEYLRTLNLEAPNIGTKVAREAFAKGKQLDGDFDSDSVAWDFDFTSLREIEKIFGLDYCQPIILPLSQIALTAVRREISRTKLSV